MPDVHQSANQVSFMATFWLVFLPIIYNFFSFLLLYTALCSSPFISSLFVLVVVVGILYTCLIRTCYACFFSARFYSNDYF